MSRGVWEKKKSEKRVKKGWNWINRIQLEKIFFVGDPPLNFFILYVSVTRVAFLCKWKKTDRKPLTDAKTSFLETGACVNICVRDNVVGQYQYW